MNRAGWASTAVPTIHFEKAIPISLGYAGAMPWVFFFLLIGLLPAAAVGANSEASANAVTPHDPQLSAEQIKKLDSGEVLINTRKVDGHDVPETTMHVVVEAPPQDVWNLIKNCAHYKRTMPRIADSKRVSVKGNIITCQVTADMPFPLPDLTSVTRGVHTEKDGFWQRKWELIEGDYKVNRGAWTIRYFNAHKGRALASYRLHAVPKMPLPTSILNAAQKKTLPGLAKRLRKEVAAAQGRGQ
jgi:ribosome-associated toxin RatA of RatAB toxin-antitoxin module